MAAGLARIDMSECPWISINPGLRSRPLALRLVFALSGLFGFFDIYFILFCVMPIVPGNGLDPFPSTISALCIIKSNIEIT